MGEKYKRKSVMFFFLCLQFAGPEITWIDSQKPIFAVCFNLISTVYTKDQHLQNLFAHAERLHEPKTGASLPPETETCKILKVS